MKQDFRFFRYLDNGKIVNDRQRAGAKKLPSIKDFVETPQPGQGRLVPERDL